MSFKSKLYKFKQGQVSHDKFLHPPPEKKNKTEYFVVFCSQNSPLEGSTNFSLFPYKKYATDLHLLLADVGRKVS